MSVASDPFEIAKAFGRTLPTARRVQAAQTVMSLKGSGKKTLKAMDELRHKQPVKKSETLEDTVSLLSDPFKITKSFKNPSERYKRRTSVEAGKIRAANKAASDMNDMPLAREMGLKASFRHQISGDTTPPVAGLDDVAAKGRRVMATRKLVRRAGATAALAIPVATVAAAGKPEKVKKSEESATSLETDPFEISKAFDNRPKITGHAVTAYDDSQPGKLTQHDPDTMTIARTGKTLILRRPKYSFAAYPKGMKDGMLAQRSGKVKPDKDTRRKLHTEISSGKKKGRVNGLSYQVSKVDRDHLKRVFIHDDRFKRNANAVAGKQKKAEKKSGLGQFRSSEPTLGRRALVALSPTLHGAVAGKKDHKLRAVGNQTGMAVAGSVSGGLLGAGLTRNMVGAQAGMMAGNLTGGQLGLNRAQNMGYLKPQKKD